MLIVGGAVVGFTTGNWQLAKIMITSGASIALSGLNRPRSLADRQGAILENRASAEEPLPLLYGTARVGNILIDIRVHLGSLERRRLVMAGAWCHGSRDGGDIAGIADVWFDDRKAINAAGVVQSPFSAVVPNQGGIKHLEYAHHLGSTGQAVDARLNTLFPTFWPAAAQGRGVAYTRFELWFNNDIFPSGIPRITAQIRGNRVHDPRDGLWKHSDNPALCGRDFLLSPIYGFGVPAANIDDQSVIDGANYCDELVSIPGGGTQKRFTLNGWVDTGLTIQEILAQLGTACRGQWVNEGDKWRLVIRRQQAVSGFKINETNTVEGSWSFILPGAADAPNVIRVNYVDPGREAQPDIVQWPEPGAANPYLVEDNGYESRLELELPFTDNRLRAQQIGMTLLKEGREGIAAICTLQESALAVRIGEIVEVTQPTPAWVDKPFWVVALLLAPDATVQAILTEYEPTVYDLDAQVAQPAIPDTGLPDPFTCTPPTALVLDSSAAQALLLKDGTYVGRIKTTWTKSDDAFIDYYEIQAKRNTDADWDSFGRVPGSDVPLIYVYPVTEELWNVRISAVNTLGIRSTWVSGNTTVTTPNPGVDSVEIEILATGQVNLIVQTRNALSVKAAAKVDGTEPTDTEIRAAAAVNTDASGRATVNNVGTVAPNGTVKIGAFAYELAAGAGRESAPVFRRSRIWDQQAGALLTVTAEFVGGKRLVLSVKATGFVSAKWATTTVFPFPAEGTGTCAALDADGAAVIDTATIFTFAQKVYITVTPYPGAACTGVAGAAVKVIARPAFADDQYDDAIGKRRRPGLYDDGHIALKGDVVDSAGERAHANVKESGGKVINRLLAKTLAADPDSLDGTPEGTTYKKLLMTHRRQLLNRKRSHGGDVLTEGGFEDGGVFWTQGGAISFPTNAVNAHTGNRYCEVTVAVPTDVFNLDGDGNLHLHEVQPGDVVQWGGYCGRVSGDGTAFFSLAIVDKDAIVISGNGSTQISAAPYQLSTGEVTIPVGAKYVRLKFTAANMTVSSTYRYDDAFLKILRPTGDLLPGALRSGINESGGKPVNRLLAKALAADPDTADSVAVGLLRDVVKLTALTSGEVDFSKVGVLNRVAANLLRAGGGATVQAIIANLTDASHAGSAMQESGGKLVNRLYAKALAADVDTIDSVVDGASFAKILGNRLSSGAILRSGAFSDGHYAGRFTTTDGLTGHSGLLESGAKALNRLFAKPLAADPDTADSVATGVVKRAVAFTTLNSSEELITKVHRTAAIGALVAHSLEKRAGIFFSESFEETPNTQGWDSAGSATETLVSTVGVATVGPNVLQAAGYMWRIFPRSLPFNPSKLYRFRARYRQTVDGSNPGVNNIVYIGLQTFKADGSPGNNNGGYAYVCITNDPRTVAQGWVERTGWVKGATDDGLGSPVASADPRNPSPLDANVVWIRPFIAVNYNGTGIPGTTQVDYFQIEELDEDAEQRLYNAINSSNRLYGSMEPTAKIYEGSVVYALYRHREESTVQGPDTDGDVAITFTQTYQSAPMIFFKGGQYVSFSQTLGTGAGAKHRMRIQALDVTATGFTSRTKIVNTGTTTPQTDDFASGNSITVVGNTAEVNLDPAGANDDTYTVHYFVSVTLSNPLTDPNVSLTVAIDSNDGVGGWVERATFQYNRASAGTSTWTEEQKPIVVSGIGLNDDIRLRAKSFIVHDATGSFIIRGGDAGGTNPEAYNGVTYTTATDTTESAIPVAGDQVTWVAQEVT